MCIQGPWSVIFLITKVKANFKTSPNRFKTTLEHKTQTKLKNFCFIWETNTKSLFWAPTVHQNWSKAHDWPVKNDIVASLPIKLKKKIDTLGSRGSLADIRDGPLQEGGGWGISCRRNMFSLSKCKLSLSFSVTSCITLSLLVVK